MNTQKKFVQSARAQNYLVTATPIVLKMYNGELFVLKIALRLGETHSVICDHAGVSYLELIIWHS